MIESSLIRENLITIKNYTPYCGNNISRNEYNGCDNPRTIWSKEKQQFYCPDCFWESVFPDDFIKRYKDKWSV